VSTPTARADERTRAARVPSLSLPGRAGIPARRIVTPSAALSPRQAPPARAHEPRPAPASDAHAVETVAVGVAAGLALAAVCGAELVVAVIAVALDAGRLLLGLGLAIDACARVLGALDSGRVGKTDWAWACAIVGSPAVVAAALLWPRPRRPGRLSAPGDIPTEAAPLAGLMATLALLCVLVGLVT
jgi:hypothetical protein